MERLWLTVEEAADYLQVSVPTVYRWMREGVLPRHKVGKVARIKKEDLDSLMEEGRE